MFGDPADCLYIDLIVTLRELSHKEKIQPAVRAKANGYADNLLKYQTILTAQTFLRIFHTTTPLSEYLQTSGMDLLSAHRFVTQTQETMKQYKRDFAGVKEAADAFVKWANEQLNDSDDAVEDALPNVRPRKKKNIPGELCGDLTVQDAFPEV